MTSSTKASDIHLNFTPIWQLFLIVNKEALAGLYFHATSETLIACRAIRLRFFKVETLLNTAFDGICIAMPAQCEFLHTVYVVIFMAVLYSTSIFVYL